MHDANRLAIQIKSYGRMRTCACVPHHFYVFSPLPSDRPSITSAPSPHGGGQVGHVIALWGAALYCPAAQSNSNHETIQTAFEKHVMSLGYILLSIQAASEKSLMSSGRILLCVC